MSPLHNRRVITLSVQIIVLCLILLLLHYSSFFYTTWFIDKIFPFLQYWRCRISNQFVFSIGDLLYGLVGIYLLLVLVRFFRANNSLGATHYWIAVLRCVRFTAIVLIVLYLNWSALYEQKPLAQKLSLAAVHTINPKRLFSFDSILISRMNNLAPQLKTVNLDTIEIAASDVYAQSFDAYVLHAKPSLFAFALPYMGISGYFNPFSGEAQIDPSTPDFMMPFLIMHEMAHQTGIAAENDANLMAYIQCVSSNESHFQYAAYFNLWLYVHNKVQQMDSIQANRFKAQLNPISIQQLHLLKQRNRYYHTFLDDCTTFIYDRFLKLANQKEGIASYTSVAYTALAWEIKKGTIL